MTNYELTWITPQLAVGHAPMSYEDLDAIKKQGINAVVNLCGEFCDLHEIEEEFGFDVYFLPVPDEWVPDMDSLEKALEWLDEAIYLGKKVLVHCRHGIGRTGTFVASYLLRRGLGLKEAERCLKGTKAVPSNYYQWKLLRKYQKKSPPLKLREPSIELKSEIDLRAFFSEYEFLVREVEKRLVNSPGDHDKREDTGIYCCRERFQLEFIETLYLSKKINTEISLEMRKEVVLRATKCRTKKDHDFVCPLYMDERCILMDYRPIRCRAFKKAMVGPQEIVVKEVLNNISRQCFFSISGGLSAKEGLKFWIDDVCSGKFVQSYFRFLLLKEKSA
ncbi:dual specificity protein phosphatase [Dissulfuribacter thermophilus]|uniref:Dual specificity protein phosphatase n=1 Tax=Dissulfuribacter thermophilus TaxID=1156395 RepID=A0A1B9F6I1_9BACT|nr:dual specificity protein phosphatase family protein [Dissulfuribacter thermophilus]OCC15415.1 dual specificity protein phosphatase [Dissulfuribacter thermophilus]